LFVGASRIELLDRMHRSFRATRDDGRPRMWLLTAPSGWGKTRLVQELYARLAAGDQAAAPYWPPAIVDAEHAPFATARKRIAPPLSATVPGSPRLPWMWWGIECYRLADGTLGRALDAGIDQVHAHAEALIATEHGLLEQAGDLFDVSSATVGILALFVGALAAPIVAAPIAAVAAAREVVTLTGRIRDLVRRRRRRDQGSAAAAAGFATSVVDRLVQLLEQLGEALPIVLVLDDAHHADATTIDVVNRLLAKQRLRVLVIALAWPGVADSPLASWLRSLPSGAGAAPVERVDLQPLDRGELVQLASSLVPSTAPEVLDAFCDRYDNPLMLRAALELPRVERRTTGGRVDMAPADVVALPATIEGLFTETWAALSPPVQSALVVASLFGRRFVPELVVQAGGAAGLATADLTLGLAGDPHRWTRALDRSLHEFVEGAFQRVAAAAVPELLGPGDVATIRNAFADLIADHGVAGRLSRRAWIEAAATHLANVEAGRVGADARAIDVALGLGTAMALDNDTHSALALYDRASAWATTAAERLSVTSQRAFQRGLAGDVPGAIEMLRAALAAAPVATADRALLVAQNDLAFWLAQIDQRELATTLFAELFDRVVPALGPEDRLALTVRRNYAHELGLTGRVAEARRLSEQLILDFTRIDGPTASTTLIERSYHASWIHDLEGPGPAAALLRDLVPAMVEELGPVIGPTLAARNNLAGWLWQSGHEEEAMAAWRALAADLDAHDAPPSREADDARQWVAYFAFRSGELGVAEALLRDALDRLSVAPDDPGALRLRSDLAFCLWHQGRSSEALGMYRELLPDALRVLGPQDSLAQRIARNIDELAAAG
jgi:hypothetical protein